MRNLQPPEKPQYNMATSPFHDKPPPPPILHNCPFSSKNFQTPPPPISINFEKVELPPLGEGGRTMLSVVLVWWGHFKNFRIGEQKPSV